MRRALSLLAGLLAGAALTGCQPLPQPFRALGADRPTLAVPVTQPGVLVLPVPGLGGDGGPRLTGAMVAALRARDVAAVTGVRPSRATFVLRSAAQATPTDPIHDDLGVVWRLEAPDRSVVGEHRQLEIVRRDGAWVDAIAAAAAERLAALMRPAGTDPDGPTRPAVVVLVADAPGDGTVALARAVATVLAPRGLPVAEDATLPGLPRVQLAVAAAAVDGRRSRVRLVWTVLGPDGATVGTLTQENVVPTAAITPTWGDTALVVAEAVTEELVLLLERARSAAKP
jgi:hypothetical protein